jgi:hypothetical protein
MNKGEIMKLLRSIGGVLAIALIIGLLAVPVGAQVVKGSATALNSLTMERVLVLSSLHSSLTSNLPASVLASIAAGTLEVHEQTNYNPQAATLTSTFFLMPAGSTPPTNLGTVPVSNILAIVGLSADTIYVTSSAVQIVGTISQSTAPLFGTTSYQGTPSSVSFGYTKDTPPKLHDVIETVAGVAVAYTPTATGTFTVTLPPTGPGGPTGGTGVTIVVNGVTGATAAFQTTVNQIFLDASASTSSNPGALTYAWSIAPNAPGAVISFPGGNTAKPIVQLSSGHQTYTINLTVTDATGASATSVITIQYL